MLLTDEQYVIKWLSQYGPLPKAQVVRLLRDKSPTTAERLLNRMKRDQRIADVGDGYYLAWTPIAPQTSGSSWRCGCCCNSSTVWSLCPTIQPPTPASYSSSTLDRCVVVLYEGEQHLAKLLHPQEDLKYIFVLPNIQMASQLVLPPVPCLFSTVEFQEKRSLKSTFSRRR